ncbi:response regulator transcription factor [Parvicella tangerina]|uniref:Transcriptional regulatory protein DegU n=1 Tax=Parvicella tangerina TaxID=2829795 RepID=A0A916JRJ3_9FLAO|nr:response regulator transcription factor [Parvicella tangerina]CAG5086087.1 Transcriptional regulatory protein DegU [Parvicella tangerina]
MARILLVDDHIIFRDGLKSLINNLDGYEVVAEAGDGQEALKILNALNIDLVITDLHMPVMNGIELTQRIKTDYPTIKVTLLTMDADRSYIDTINELGANGYITKATGIEDLKDSLENILNGGDNFQVVLSSREQFTAKAKDRRVQKLDCLTKREKETLSLIAEGLTDKEIAKKLFLSPYTVITHRKSLLSKLGMSNKVELTRFALETGITNLK